MNQDERKMANTEWWQRGPIDGIPAILQPIAHILFQVRESVGEIVEPLTEQEWNARPAGVASAAFHVRREPGWPVALVPHKDNNLTPLYLGVSGDHMNYLFYEHSPGVPPPVLN